MIKKTENKTYAVITGDIVNSSALNNEQRTRMLSVLKTSFREIEPTFGKKIFASDFTIFRGDSFQGVLSNPSYALEAAIYIRAALKAANPGPRKNMWDARIAIGIGKISYFPGKGSEAEGEAFHFSGPMLDTLKKTRKLHIFSSKSDFNKEMNVECHLLDILMDKWSANQAAVVLSALSKQHQEILAKQLSVSQPAIQKRLLYGGYSAIEDFIERYKELIKRR